MSTCFHPSLQINADGVCCDCGQPAPALIVTADVQGRATNTRCGRDGWLVYTPASGPALDQDLIQRGLFWRKHDADIFAATPILVRAVHLLNEIDLDPHEHPCTVEAIRTMRQALAAALPNWPAST